MPEPLAKPRRLPDRAAAAESLVQLVHEAHRRGWCLGTSGNFSVTLAEEPLRLLITRSGCDKGRLTPADLVVVGMDGKAVEPQSARPSIEAVLHGKIAMLTRAGAVLHTHSVWGTLLSAHHADVGGFVITGYEMLKGLEGIDSPNAKEFVPVIANSPDMTMLAQRASDQLSEWPSTHGLLIAGHGLYTWGATLERAQRHLETLEFLVEVLSRKAGY